jgi:molybdopterin biosynthesis enzyme
MAEASPPAETECVLKHPLFARLPNPVFRRSDADGQAVVVLQLGAKEAAVPVASLAREFGIRA